MSEGQDRPVPGGVGGDPADLLRLKYLDFCSARVAELLLTLTPDEIYLLAEEAAQEVESPGGFSYSRAVELATDRVSRRVGLPSYEVWVEEYQRDPDRFEPDLMGLWESDMTGSAQG